MEEKDRKYLESLRKIRAYAILAKGDTPRMVNEEEFLIPSQSNPETRYKVVHHEGWECSCPDFQERHLKCKHIQAVEMWLNLRQNLMDKDILALGDDLLANQVRCPCGSFNVIKHGKRKTKQGMRQRYLCKDCRKAFVNDQIKGHKANGQLIALTMDLYYKGLSLRDIADTIYQFYGIKLHHETVRRWINKFMRKINEYIEQFEPDVGDVWHTDEQKIKTKRDDWVWSWNTLDRDTRFLLATNITKERSILDARQIFRKSKDNTGKKPKIVMTDGLPAYHDAFNKEFYTHFFNSCKHIANVGIAKKDNNNMIERFHGTVREREKVMRGMQNGITALEMLENHRTYYNFIRKHTGIDGLTPAQMAGIDIGFERNRWMELLTKSL